MPIYDRELDGVPELEAAPVPVRSQPTQRTPDSVIGRRMLGAMAGSQILLFGARLIAYPQSLREIVVGVIIVVVGLGVAIVMGR